MSLKLTISIKLVFLIALYLNISEAAKGKLLWSDEFNSLVTFNSNWNAEIGGHGWGNNELQYYTNFNSRIKNSNLIIETRREAYGGSRFTSSRLISKKAFKYGVFEMRAKLPKGRGTWPAFWLLASKRPINWPLDGEIDVMEHVGYDPNVIHGTIHCQKYNHLLGTQKGKSTRINNAFDAYHIYTLEWSSTKITVSVDGFKYFEYTKEDNTYNSWPFDNTFNIILNTAVGGDWGGVQGVDETIFPVLYTIDYVRQYEYVEDGAPTVESVRRVSLRAVVNNKYVSADNNGASPLIANKDGVSTWELFDMTKYTDGYVSFKSLSNQKHVSADNYGNAPLIANKDTALEWELFYLVANADGTHSFRAKVNNKYVCADNYGIAPLIADRDTIGGWEKFNLNYV